MSKNCGNLLSIKDEWCIMHLLSFSSNKQFGERTFLLEQFFFFHLKRIASVEEEKNKQSNYVSTFYESGVEHAN